MAVAAWVGVGVTAYAVQDSLIFPVQPVDSDELAAAASQAGARVLHPMAEDGTQLYAWHIPQGGERALLFLRGNGGGITAGGFRPTGSWCRASPWGEGWRCTC